MEILKQLRLLAYNFFMVANPAWLLAVFVVSFFSEEKAMDCLYGLRWFFFITLLLASPQLYHNYKINSNAKK
jgi:hypothetical protein